MRYRDQGAAPVHVKLVQHLMSHGRQDDPGDEEDDQSTIEGIEPGKQLAGECVAGGSRDPCLPRASPH